MKTKPTSYRFDENDLLLAINKSGIKKPQKLMDFLLSEYVRDLKPEYLQLPKDFIVEPKRTGVATVDGAIKSILEPTNLFLPKNEHITISQETKMEKPEIENRIKELESELKSPPKTPLIGLRNWKLIREQELAKLKKLFYLSK